MANGSSRLFPALIGLFLGFLLGWFIPHPEPAAAPGSGPAGRKLARAQTGDHVIGVHGDGSLTLPEAHISRSANDHVAWVADADQGLFIAFPEKGFPTGVTEPPFKGMTSRPGVDPKSTEWIVRCGGNTCFSGDINQKLSDGPPPDKTLKFKYDQIVAGKRVDGLIIIEP